MASDRPTARSPAEYGWISQYRAPDGGFSYLAGRKPRVEPTSYAVLAGVAERRDIEWLLTQLTSRFAEGGPCADGVVQRELHEHSWLLALATAALDASGHDARDGHDAEFADQVVELLAAQETRKTYLDLSGNDEPELDGALAWRAPSYGWVEPSSWGLLAETGVLAADPPPAVLARVRKSVPKRVEYLLARITTDGAWNYGNVTIMDVDLVALPQTSAVCLLALASAYSAARSREIKLPEFDPTGPLERLRELAENQPSRLTTAWQQLALMAWGNWDAATTDVPVAAPRPGESAVDGLLSLVVARAKHERVVPMVEP